MRVKVQILNKKNMGKVSVDIEIVNFVDEEMAARGLIDPEKIRKVILKDVLVDTGASTVCLPLSVIKALGLSPLGEVMTETAAGTHNRKIFRGASFKIGDRTATFDCLELPEGSKPLLGVFPMEFLGIEVDLQNEKLIFLEMNENHSYLTIYNLT